LSPVVGWLGGNQLCVVQLAGQLWLLEVHMKHTVKFCEVFMMVFDIQTYTCFELSPSSNVQEKCNIVEDGPSVLKWWGSGNAPTLVDSFESHSHPLDLVRKYGTSFWIMLQLYIR
jgi:hypothetical protein